MGSAGAGVRWPDRHRDGDDEPGAVDAAAPSGLRCDVLPLSADDWIRHRDRRLLPALASDPQGDVGRVKLTFEPLIQLRLPHPRLRVLRADQDAFAVRRKCDALNSVIVISQLVYFFTA